MVVPINKRRGNRQKLMNRKLCMSMRKKFFTVWMTVLWNRLPREVVVSPSLKNHVGTARAMWS